MVSVLTLLAAALLVLNFPIFAVLLLSSLVALALTSNVPSEIVIQTLFGSIDKFALMAIPFFIFAATVMERGGMSRRLIAIMNHDRRRLVERVGYVTSPGFLDGGDARRRAGLDRGGPAAVITDLAVLRPHGPERALHLASWHPGADPEEIRARTGWDLALLPGAAPTPPPSAAELAALRSLDREGFWRAGRDEAKPAFAGTVPDP